MALLWPNFGFVGHPVVYHWHQLDLAGRRKSQPLHAFGHLFSEDMAERSGRKPNGDDAFSPDPESHPPGLLPLTTDTEEEPSMDDNKVMVDDRTSRRKGRVLVRRQRARHACLDCRARKVRCDVSVTGTPCTNCKLDDHECTIQRRKTRR